MLSDQSKVDELVSTLTARTRAGSISWVPQPFFGDAIYSASLPRRSYTVNVEAKQLAVRDANGRQSLVVYSPAGSSAVLGESAANVSRSAQLDQLVDAVVWATGHDDEFLDEALQELKSAT
jgi:hypothetical protein